MILEEGIFQFLKANTALQAVLPNEKSIFLGFVPESAKYPCIMFQKISTQNDTTMDGPSGYIIRRYQFNIYGQDSSNSPGSGYVQAQKVASILIQQLDGYSGTLPDGSQVYNTILDTEIDEYTDDQTYIAIQDYFIHYPRPVA
jgi:Protein of unknown function (DUF3168)